MVKTTKLFSLMVIFVIFGSSCISIEVLPSEPEEKIPSLIPDNTSTPERIYTSTIQPTNTPTPIDTEITEFPDPMPTNTNTFVLNKTSTDTPVPTKTITSIPTNTNTPLPPPQGQIVLNEDFDDNSAQGFRSERGAWRIVSDSTGNRVYEINNSNNSDYPIVIISDSFSNGTIECRVRFLNPGMAHILFRLNEVGLYTFAIFTSVPRFVLSYAYSDDNWRWNEVDETLTTIQENTWYTIRVDAISNLDSTRKCNRLFKEYLKR